MSTAVNPPGRIITKPLSDGTVKIKVLSDEGARVKSITPVPTIWGREDGKPIYDRLPGVSESYKKEYFGEVGRGLVYIDPQFGNAVGDGSLQVGKWGEDEHVLIIESGAITWAYGTIETDTLAIDLRLINGEEGPIQDGEYQVGYYLDYVQDVVEETSLFNITESSLGASVSIYKASATNRNQPVSAMFSEVDLRSWSPGPFSLTGSYTEGESVIVDFTAPVKCDTFVLSAENARSARATCAVYRSDDGIVWFLEDSRNSIENSWTLIPRSQSRHRYWRFFFWDGTVSVSNVTYTGEAFFQNLRPTGPITRVEPFIEGKFDQIDRPHIVLATVAVKDKAIVRVTDNRKISSIKYEPVASWLTDFHDTTLRKIFKSVEQYSSLYLSPVTGADNIYEELLSSGFQLSESFSRQELILPERISLAEGWFITSNADLQTDPAGQGVTTNPNGIQIIAEAISLYRSNSSVTPSAAIFIGEPEEASDFATLNYVEQSLILDLDNGIFT